MGAAFRWQYRSLSVRRTSLDAAAERDDDTFPDLFEAALEDGDKWIRWKAARSLHDLGIGPSRTRVEALREDPDFQVRFEVERALQA